MPDLDREAELSTAFVELAEASRYGELVDVLDLLVRATTAWTRAEQAAVILRSGDATYRAVASTHERALDVEEAQLGIEGGPCIESMRAGEIVEVPDISAVQGQWPAFTAAALSAGLGGALAIPISVDERVVAGVNVFLARPGTLSTDEVTLITSMARIVASGLRGRQEHDRQAAVEEQLTAALESRVVIEQAKGYLSYAHGEGVAEAFTRLRGHARSRQLPLRAVAERVIGGDLLL